MLKVEDCLFFFHATWLMNDLLIQAIRRGLVIAWKQRQVIPSSILKKHNQVGRRL